MKVGDIALVKNKLVRITQIEIERTPVLKKVKTGMFCSKKVETGEFKEETERVWWQEIGQEWTKRQQSNSLSAYFDWDTAIFKATFVLNQVEILNKQ